MKKQYVTPHILSVDLESEGVLAASDGSFIVNPNGGYSSQVGSSTETSGSGYGEKGGRNSSFRDDYGSNW